MAAVKKLVLILFTALIAGTAAPQAEAQEALDNWSDQVQQCVDGEGEYDDSEHPFARLKPLGDLARKQGEDSKLGKLQRLNCKVANGLNHPGSAVSAGASEFWGDPVGDLTKAVMEGNSEAFEWALTFWMDQPTGGRDAEKNIAGVKNIVYAAAGFGLIASFIFGGMRMAANRRMGVQDGLEDQGEVILKWLLFSIAIPAFAPAAIAASDTVAQAIMEQFGSPDQLAEVNALSEHTAGPIIMLVLAGICVAGSLMQLIALITRVLVFPLVVGFMPLFAAFSFSERGKQGLEHLIAYGIAIILFKPVSAILYCVVLWNVNQGDGDDLATAGINVLMLALAGFSAPALMRALVPAVAQGGGGSAGNVASAATGIAGGVGGAAGALLGRAGSAVGAKAGSAAAGQAAGAAGGASSGGVGGGAGPGASGPLGGGGGGPAGPSRTGAGGGFGGGAGGGSGATASGAGAAGGSQRAAGARSSAAGGGSGAAGRATAQGAGGAAGRGSTQAASRAAGGRSGGAGATASGSTGGSRGSAQPSPANVGANTSAAGGAGGAASQGSKIRAAVGKGTTAVGSLANGAGRVAESGGGGVQRTQQILDESIGVQGSYAGQVHR